MDLIWKIDWTPSIILRERLSAKKVGGSCWIESDRIGLVRNDYRVRACARVYARLRGALRRTAISVTADISQYGTGGNHIVIRIFDEVEISR